MTELESRPDTYGSETFHFLGWAVVCREPPLGRLLAETLVTLVNENADQDDPATRAAVADTLTGMLEKYVAAELVDLGEAGHEPSEPKEIPRSREALRRCFLAAAYRRVDCAAVARALMALVGMPPPAAPDAESV
jgi:hypothetical protein